MGCCLPGLYAYHGQSRLFPYPLAGACLHTRWLWYDLIGTGGIVQRAVYWPS